MAIFGFKKRKDDKLQAEAQVTKANKPAPKKVGAIGGKPAVLKPAKVAAVMDAKLGEREKVISAPSMKNEGASHAASVIIRPRVTEKSGLLSQGGVYTFEVMRDANKQSISRAITALYKVTPVKIAVINTPIKNVFVKGRRGTVAGIRKAVVTVKKGEKIDFV